MPTSKQFWNNVADKYASAPIRDEEAYQFTLDRTRSYLKPTDRVLELGCGTGSTALLLADSVHEIIGSDIAPRMVEIASEKAEQQEVANARFVAGDVMADHIAEGAPFDAILALNLLHLVDDIPAAMRRVHGMLKPGGLFISKTPCLKEPAIPLKWRLMMLAIPLMQLFGKAPSTVHRFSIAELEQEITKAGFEIIEVGNYPAAPPSRYIVAKRQ